MSNNAIKVKNLSKMFKLYPSQGKRFFEYITFGKKKNFTEFWALNDISFSVPKGTTFGILGQNGSGKSTLLSILAGVLEPSGGQFTVNGKISAILELGAGFHPEFSGRANAYMYGSIMGLSRDDIDKRLPEIIQFSELGEFIDQPLRTYSSGMYARLAFSVAINVNAEILIIDEALAVGDALFQHRCFRKIKELKKTGVTILYVGHDTGAVRSLCDNAMLLDRGRMLNIGESVKISDEYLALIAEREKKLVETSNLEYGWKPDNNWKSVYNLVDNLILCNNDPTESKNIRKDRVEINNVPRKIIFAHPPSELRFQINVKKESIISFAIGISPSAYEFIKSGVRFLVYINNEECFNKILDPTKSVSDKGWHNQTVNLAKYSDSEIILVFKTEGISGDLSYCWGCWGWPNIFIKKSDNHHITALNSDLSDQLQETRFGNRKIEITDVVILDEHGNLTSTIISGKRYTFCVKMRKNVEIFQNIIVGLAIKNRYVEVFGTNTFWENFEVPKFGVGKIVTISFTQIIPLNNGIYSISCGVVSGDNEYSVEVLDRRYEYSTFVVTQCPKITGLVKVNYEITFNENGDRL